jgi:hypothetical protein
VHLRVVSIDRHVNAQRRQITVISRPLNYSIAMSLCVISTSNATMRYTWSVSDRCFYHVNFHRGKPATRRELLSKKQSHVPHVLRNERELEAKRAILRMRAYMFHHASLPSTSKIPPLWYNYYAIPAIHGTRVSELWIEAAEQSRAKRIARDTVRKSVRLYCCGTANSLGILSKR